MIYRRSAYYNQLKRWGDAPNKKSNYLKDDELRAKIISHYNDNMSHKEMLRALQQFDGYPDLTEWQLRSIRKSAGLVLRHHFGGISAPEFDRAAALIRADLNSSLISNWGYRAVQAHLRSHHNVYVSSPTVMRLLREVDIKGTKARRVFDENHNPRLRKRYFVKGPNIIWSIDGYDKIAAYGFQIYGFIDAFSRKVLGMFIGLSNGTQIAVSSYSIRMVKEFGVPKAIRADKGAETMLHATWCSTVWLSQSCQARYPASEDYGLWYFNKESED